MALVRRVRVNCRIATAARTGHGSPEPQPECAVLPDPLHPIVVHFPIVLAILLPFITVGALWAIRTGAKPMRAWSVAIAFGAALTASAVVAEKTGEQQEDRVEHVVNESRVEAHAEAAEALVVASVVVLVVLAAGLVPGTAGLAARYAAVLGALVVAVMVFRVGMTGGDLVYKYNAASAYASPGGGGSSTTEASASADGADKRERGEKGESGGKDDDDK